MKVKFILVLIAVAFLAVFVQGCKEKGYSADTRNDSAAIEKTEEAKGEIAFTLKNFDGKEVNLSEFAGKIVVLEWANYDCPFVKRHYAAGTMVETAKKFVDKDVVWLAINSTDYANVAGNKKFAEEYGMKYVLDDHEGKAGKKFGATRTPEMFVIDKQGQIVYHGAIDDDSYGDKEEKINYVAKALAELTAGKKVTTAKTAPYGCTVKYAK